VKELFRYLLRQPEFSTTSVAFFFRLSLVVFRVAVSLVLLKDPRTRNSGFRQQIFFHGTSAFPTPIFSSLDFPLWSSYFELILEEEPFFFFQHVPEASDSQKPLFLYVGFSTHFSVGTLLLFE